MSDNMYNGLSFRKADKRALDKLGRPNIGFSYINKNKLGEQKQFNKRLMISLSDEDYKALKKRAKSRKLSELIRTYIQWGLENDER